MSRANKLRKLKIALSKNSNRRGKQPVTLPKVHFPDDDREWFEPIHRKLGGSSVHLMMRVYPCEGTSANPRRWKD